MKRMKNENGMALVLVLLLIVVFSVLGMTLFNLTATNAKQTNRIEVDMQAVDVAEMGVVYYRNALVHHINKELYNEFVKTIGEIISYNNSINQSTDPSQQPIEINAKKIIEYTIARENIFVTKNFKVDSLLNTAMLATNDYPSYTFKISQDDSNITFNENTATVIFNSTGSVMEQTVTVIGDFTIDLEDLITKNLSVNNSLSSNDISSKIPVQNPNTPSPLITHQNLTTGGNQSFINKNIHIIEDYNAHAIKDFSGTHLFIDRDMNVNQNFTQGLSNSVLYTGGNLTFHNGTGNISNSIIYVSGTFTSKLINGAVKNSKIFVEGNLNITNTGKGNGSVAPNSLICVQGEINTSIDNFKANGTNIFSLAEMKIKGQSMDSFYNKCTNSTTGEANLKLLLNDISSNIENADYYYQ